MSNRKKREKKSSQKKHTGESEEAIEEHVSLSESEHSSNEPEGEDLLENMEKDYKPIKGLDEYEKGEFDETQYANMTLEERRKVEKVLEERDARRKFGARIPSAILAEMEGTDEEEIMRALRRKKMGFGMARMTDEQIRESEAYIDKEDVKGKLLDWLSQPHAARFIRSLFQKFIKGYREEQNDEIYENRIVDMSKTNKQSLEINYPHLSKFNKFLSEWVILHPEIVLPYLNDVAFELTCEIFPRYSDICKEIFVRIRDIPETINLRNLKCEDIGHLIKINGVVTKRSSVYPKLRTAYFSCVKCGEINGPFNFNTNEQENINIGSCPMCQSNGPYRLESDECQYRNYQRITVQESPGSVPPGRVPRQKEVILTNDLVDSSRPGDSVEITGIYKSKFEMGTNIKYSFPVFTTYIEANCIKRLNDIDVEELTEEDKTEMKKLSKKPNITQLIFNSIAPSIYGNEFIKKALAIAMFGGVQKDPQSKHKIRGDINVLLLGDPGTSKSQMLKYIQTIFSRSVYTTGKGASAVGLTASVQKDPVTKEWTLEGGALVLADKGICLIDEFDKMNDQDRTSIHEAMEQQSISISKVGIVTSLQARCSVIAAANPIKGRYDSRLSFDDNVELTDPILSRFDILCVVRDTIDPIIDEQLATFVINSHIKSHPEIKKEEALLEEKRENIERLDQDTLRKYIIYARKFITPKLSELNKNKVSKFYSELRSESQKSGGIPIAVRHLESIVRIAEAHAKMELRESVRSEDIDFSIQMMLQSFLQSQKYSIANALTKKFSHYLNQNQDHNQLLLNLLSKKAKEQFQYLKYFNHISEMSGDVQILKEAFEKDAAELGIHDFNEFYNSQVFKNKNKIEDGYIICTL